MSGAAQLRFLVVVFCILGGANLVMAAVQLGLGLTPRLPPVVGGAAHVLAAWGLARGSAIARFVLAAMSLLTVVLGTLMGSFLIGSEYPLYSILSFVMAALCLFCLYLLLFSRPLRTELKARQQLNREADRIAFARSVSES